jgi:excisionase family DNA binding protein
MQNQDLAIQPNVYYTVEEAAARLRVSPRTVIRLLKTHALLGVKIGRRWRILGANLLNLAAESYNEMRLQRDWWQATLPSLLEVWSNDADAIYDEL